MKKTWTKAAAVLAIGAAAGLLNGLLGTGGGILLVLGLTRLGVGRGAGGKDVFPLAVLCTLPLSAFSLWRYPAAEIWEKPFWPWLFPAAALGGLLGAFLQGRIRPRLLSGLFSGLMLLSGILAVTR